MPKRLTPDEEDCIVELKLDGVSVRVIAADMDISTNTVQRVWNRYLDARSEALRDQVAREHQLVLARLDRIALAAWSSYKRALEESEAAENGGAQWATAAKGFLAEATKAEKEYARLAGMDITRVEHTGKDGGPIEVTRDVKAELAARLAAMTPQSPTAPDASSEGA